MIETSNLKAVLSHFQISNIDLSKATGIDPSLISRYISGNRKLKKTSSQVEEIAEYLLIKADSIERIEWLQEQFHNSRISDNHGSVLNMKHNLKLWISTDTDSSEGEQEESYEFSEPVASGSTEEKLKELEFGIVPIVDNLSKRLWEISEEQTIDMLLTGDKLRAFMKPEFSSMLHDILADRKISMNIVICVSADTRHINKIVQEYMGEMVTGTMRFYTFFGTTQNVAEHLYLMLPGSLAVMISESSIGSAEPVGTFITDAQFVEELCQSFDATYRYSQPMFNIFNDSYTRNMIEVLYGEYCLPGELSVVKDNINPMYMSFENYCRVLRENNPDDSEYAWKCNEYRRFNDGFDNMLATGMSCREIISLKRMRNIIQERKCLMAGLYFLGVGFFELDLQGCRDILAGYIDYLNRFPNFSLLILDDLPELHSSNCWHVKKGQSVAINDWNGKEPVMCHSNHNALVQEFQKHFEGIWERGEGSLANRAYVISILQSVIHEMDHLLEGA